MQSILYLNRIDHGKEDNKDSTNLSIKLNWRIYYVPNPFGEDLTFTKDTKQSDESAKKNRDNMKRAYKRKHG